MSKIDQAVEYIVSNDVKFLRMQFVDLMGNPKNVAYPIKTDAKGLDELKDTLENGMFFDGSSIEGFVSINESDMVLKPDLSTLSVLPWRPSEKSVARVICDVYKTNGKPFEGDPRGCLKTILGKLKEEMNGSYYLGPEPEFFLVKPDPHNPHKMIPADDGGYFDLEPMDEASSVRRDIVFALEDLGYHMEASHHEVAEGQSEVNFRFEDALKTADNVITFKTTVKMIAQQHGLTATFMPKPFFGINGSGMHCNQSVWFNDEVSFYDETAPYQLSETALSYIAGILDNARALVAITNPTVNSYKRLVPGYEAPVNIAWANSNRSAIIRVPAARGKGTRVEFRAPDPTCNPYLAFTVMLAAGLDGIKKGMSAPDPVEENIFKMSEARKKELGIASVPANLSEALDELENNSILKEALGKHIFENFIELKRAEWDDFRTSVTDWETKTYLKL
ncbi:type I glutamate--ammonia ligase [Methanococcus aeolicus]|uniref:type I glutamate--ammonia ligase n=1 Tax=Methanococcus aeolicus TaxID=42879 RepID=UPI0021C6A9AE|nr:type I glutamate--ammonia ligase [Methanococcus aeolicus]UXM84152.1 type I glutamate--ammonia ligase [Methanococcus aeolicus]